MVCKHGRVECPKCPKEDVSFDINNDGKVDSKDLTLAKKLFKKNK